MATVHVARDFAAPVDRLFAHLSDHENLGPMLGAKVQRIRDGAESPNGVGSVRRLTVAGVARFEETILVSIPKERIEYTITKGSPLRGHHGVMAFSSTPSGGSHLDYTITFGSAIPGVAALVAMSLRRSIPRGLARIDAEL
jgi:hypothetical protein